uniref:Splicing factor YJU2 n=1 Tax=Plectus sambesii TaxID=2011161 RepID=A0A914XM85_9BILA
MQCNTCQEYIYKGKKFNMRRETADGETYLGLKIFRFYFRCPNCLAEITFKTDLEKCDYSQEHGATRLFEAFKLYQDNQREKEAKEEEEMKNPMKMLEKRTKMSRAEMEALGKLEELREINRVHAKINYDDVIGERYELEAERQRRQEDEDEAFVQSLFGKNKEGVAGAVVKRLKEDSDEEVDMKPVLDGPGPSWASSSSSVGASSEPSSSQRSMAAKSSIDSTSAAKKRPAPTSSQSSLLKNMVVVKKKPKQSSDVGDDGPSKPVATAPPPVKNALSGLGAYGSGSSSDEDS